MKDNKQTFIAIINGKYLNSPIKKRKVKSAFKKLEKKYNIVRYLTTPLKENAKQIAIEKYHQGFRNFISVGGDGTNYEIINGLLSCADNIEDLTLGFLPVGTGNSFVADFSKKRFKNCLNAMLENKVKYIDVIKLTHKEGDLYFINNLSIGFVSKVAFWRNKYLAAWGQSSYLIATIINLWNVATEKYNLSFDEKNDISEYSIVSFCNSKYTGGDMKFAPLANPADGVLDVITLSKTNKLNLIKLLLKVFKGTHLSSPLVNHTTCKKVIFNEQHKIPIVIDGETLEVIPLSLNVMHKHIKIFA